MAAGTGLYNLVLEEEEEKLYISHKTVQFQKYSGTRINKYITRRLRARLTRNYNRKVIYLVKPTISRISDREKALVNTEEIIDRYQRNQSPIVRVP